MAIAAVGLCCATGCSGKADSASREVAAEADSDAADMSGVFHQFTPEQIDSIKNMSRVIYSNLKISDDSTYYILEMTEEEAVKAGVTKEFYEDAVESIRDTNEAIKQAIANGEFTPGSIMTPEQLLEAVDNAQL